MPTGFVSLLLGEVNADPQAGDTTEPGAKDAGEGDSRVAPQRG